MPALNTTIVVAVALVIALSAASVWAQQLFIYPQRGQSQQQQQQDRFECHQWAVQQTGFDPTMGAAAAPPPGAPPTTGAVRGAARGAAIGAVGGAIGGDAGRGAAIGAGTGAVFGTMRRNNQIRQNEAQQAAHAQQVNQQAGAYNRALAACLSGRGYTVQ
jgi:Glycine-zipper domain